MGVVTQRHNTQNMSQCGLPLCAETLPTKKHESGLAAVYFLYIYVGQQDRDTLLRVGSTFAFHLFNEAYFKGNWKHLCKSRY